MGGFVYANFRKVNFANAEIWTNIHVCTSIVCACLPTLRPLLITMGAGSKTVQKAYGFLLKGDSSKLHLREESISLEDGKVVPNSYDPQSQIESNTTWNIKKVIDDGDV